MCNNFHLAFSLSLFTYFSLLVPLLQPQATIPEQALFPLHLLYLLETAVLKQFLCIIHSTRQRDNPLVYDTSSALFSHKRASLP